MTSLLDPSTRGRSHESRSARLPREERRQQIIEEATRIIGQRGYYGFSMQELADSCGPTDHPASMARQLLALMSGLEEQWLHDSGLLDREKRSVWVYYRARTQALASLGALIGYPPA